MKALIIEDCYTIDKSYEDNSTRITDKNKA